MAPRSTCSRLDDDLGGVRGGQLEHVADEPRQPVGLGDDVGDERTAVIGHQVLPLHDVGIRADECCRGPELVRGIGDEPALGVERPADRHERASGHDERDDRCPDQPDHADEQDGRHDALRLKVMEGEDEAALDVSHQGATLFGSDRDRQQPDLGTSRIHGSQVASLGLRGADGRRVRKPRQVDPRRVRDQASIRSEDQDERVRCRQDRVLVVGGWLGVGRRSIVERGRGGIDARSEHAVDVDVECAEGHERGGGSDPDDEQRDERERHDRQPLAGPRQQPGRRVRHRRVTTPPSGCSRRRAPCVTGPRGRARRASAAGSGYTGPPRWSRHQARTPRPHRGSGAASGPARCGG